MAEITPTFSKKTKLNKFIYNFFNSAELNLIVCFSFISISIYVTIVSIFYRPVIYPYEYNSSQLDENKIVIPLTEKDYYQNSIVSLFLFLVIALMFGRISYHLDIPTFIGYVVCGILIQNIDYLKESFIIHKYFIETVRLTSVIMIVARTAINLNFYDLRNHWKAATIISIPSTIFNCIFITFLTKIVLGFPWEISLCYAFVLGVTAPPIAFNIAQSLIQEKRGLKNNVPQILKVSTSLDNIFCIVCLNLVIDFCYEPIDYSIPSSVMHIFVGILIGLIMGSFLSIYPTRRIILFESTRLAMLFFASGGLLFFFKSVGWYGCPAFAILIMSFICGSKYRTDAGPNKKPLEQHYIDSIWSLLFEPWLFVFIGYNFKFLNLEWNYMAICMIIISSTLLFKFLCGLLFSIPLNLTCYEKIFLNLCFIPRSSIQVANSLMILNLSQNHSHPNIPDSSTQFYSNVVISLLVTGTFTQIILRVLSKKWLRKNLDDQVFFEGWVHVNKVEVSKF
uniref:Na_H_Exchanger domain-containing protein n=1 Tax=Rhabditophanes sp. KR3021 TaxID=114890 RepID=A0AC35TZ08_9BILA